MNPSRRYVLTFKRFDRRGAMSTFTRELAAPTPPPNGVALSNAGMRLILIAADQISPGDDWEMEVDILNSRFYVQLNGYAYWVMLDTDQGKGKFPMSFMTKEAAGEAVDRLANAGIVDQETLVKFANQNPETYPMRLNDLLSGTPEMKKK